MFRKAIAIINDDPDLLNIYSDVLKMSGYTVSSFSDPLLAYKKIKENPNKYSLVIIDEKIPKINGLFRSSEPLEINPKLNVIILSNLKNFKYNYKFSILKKPVSVLKLITVVNESVSKSLSHDDKF